MGDLDKDQSTPEQVESNIRKTAPKVTEPTANNLGYAMNSEKQSKYSKEQQPEDLRKLHENLVNIIHECNFPKIYVSNDKLWDFTDPSAKEIKDMVEEWIKISDKMVKWVFYMNPCFCLSLYLISKLKETYPNLAENIKLNVEIFKINDNPSAHAFIEIDDNKEWNHLIIDYARNNDVYIYRWKYHNYSDGVQPFLKDQKETTIVNIPANTFDDKDNIVSIAKKNEKNISKDFPWLSSNLIKWMLNGRTAWWVKDNSQDNYDERHKKYWDSPVYCFENGKDEQWNHKRIKIKIESNDPLKIYLLKSEDNKWNCDWSELKIDNTDPLNIKFKDWNNSTINFDNEFINNFLWSIVKK